MLVTFVSQCEKNALKKTRRILDAFADRIGDNTWQTIITQDGLNAVRKLLRKTASKSTAVSCHWLRSRTRIELVWTVGRQSAFDTQGRVSVNSTRKSIIGQHESDWHYLPLIQALTGVAALLHDWGKATQLFQDKLHPDSPHRCKGDPVRHEWISCLLLTTLVNHATSAEKPEDSQWLRAMIDQQWDENWFSALDANRVDTSYRPLDQLPPAAKLVAWLIISHHRLPETKEDLRGDTANTIDELLKRIHVDWGYKNEKNYQQRVADCFQFPKGFLAQSKRWQSALKKWAKKLEACLPAVDQVLTDGSYRVLLHHARLCLMLADHLYSSQDAAQNWPDSTGLFANTDPKNGGVLKQKLDEHLVGVAQQAVRNVYMLPAFENEPIPVKNIPSLKKRSPRPFAWQDKAVSSISQWRGQQEDKKFGFFAVNMASTGQGKTFANAKIMRALSEDGDSLRFILALGLRTLTLQTGDEYRSRIGLKNNGELAVLIGSRAVMELHQQSKDEKTAKQAQQDSGSESTESLFDEHIDYDCTLPEAGLATVLKRNKDRAFLYAPVLVCTIDHLMAATETTRGGRYILPALRLMSSDLVIDEVDDFTGNDLVAIGRLIHLAGMSGRKVMISSATIPPDLAEGYFRAYQAGWQLFCQTRNAAPLIGCAWIDEHTTRVDSINEKEKENAWRNYCDHHSEFVNKRVAHLDKVPAKRRASIIPCRTVVKADEQQQSHRERYFERIATSTLEMHQHHHTVDEQTDLRVSFGVVRVANIPPCVALTQYLMARSWPENTAVKVMAYHSQQILLLRHLQEQHLDEVLRRKETAEQLPQAFSNPVIRHHLDTEPAGVRDVVFILVATPVEEVGRDHDFDWAIIEPSSYRSLVQLAGRVLRHRNKCPSTPNIGILEYNLKGIKELASGKPACVFIRPGYEDGELRLKHHAMGKLVDVKAIEEKLDAVPRIQKPPRDHFKQREQLAHLEHAATKRLLTMAADQRSGPGRLNGYLWEHWFLTAMVQRRTPFRGGNYGETIYCLYDYKTENTRFHRREPDEFITCEDVFNIETLVCSDHRALWLNRDYQQALHQLAEDMSASPRSISERFGELNFNHDNDQTCYVYCDQWGLVKKE